MLHKKLSTELCISEDNILSTWDGAIALAKEKIKQAKRSIHVFESLRDQGMKFPESKQRRSKRREAA